MSGQKQKTTTKAKEKSTSSGEAVISKQKLKRHAALRKEIKECERNIGTSQLDLARLLYEAYKDDAYKTWKYKRFKEFVADEMQIHYRKAMYFVGIWETVTDFNIDHALVIELGWTKTKELSSVMTKKNYKAWLKKAQKLDTRELTKLAKEAREKMGTSRSSTSRRFASLNFSLDESSNTIVSEALEVAIGLTEDDDPGTALVMICQDWLEGKGQVPERTEAKDLIAYAKKVLDVELEVVGEESEDTTSAETKKKKAEAAKKKKAAAKKDKDATEEEPPEEEEEEGEEEEEEEGEEEGEEEEEEEGEEEEEEEGEEEEEEEGEDEDDIDDLLGLKKGK